MEALMAMRLKKVSENMALVDLGQGIVELELYDL